MKKILIIFLFGYFISLNSLLAFELEGSDHTVFKAAVQLWLDNDDQNSLPLLSQLASKGNIAARLLLARIEQVDRAPSEYLEQMPRDKRLALMRSKKENTPFYPSWIEIEANNNHPLAIELRKTEMPHVDIATIENLHALGEPQASDHLVRIVAIYGEPEERQNILNRNLVLDELKPYIYSQSFPPKKRGDGVEAMLHIAQKTNTEMAEPNLNDAQTLNIALLLSLGIPYGHVDASNEWNSMLEKWLFSADETKPIAQLCQQNCPHESGPCATTILGLTGGYYEIIRLDSPLESIISQVEFLSSPRARQMALRRAALMRAEHGGELASLDEIANRSQCLADLVAEQRTSRAYLY